MNECRKDQGFRKQSSFIQTYSLAKVTAAVALSCLRTLCIQNDKASTCRLGRQLVIRKQHKERFRLCCCPKREHRLLRLERDPTALETSARVYSRLQLAHRRFWEGNLCPCEEALSRLVTA